MTVSSKAFDAVHAQCGCGLGSAHGQASTSATVHTSRAISTQFKFPFQDEVEVESTNTTEPHEHEHEHELRLIISGYRWAASSNMGTFWHEASDLDNRDIAPFALLDTLTRWLPHWQGGALHVRTNDVGVLHGIRGDYSHSGVWDTVRSLCGQYDVELSAEVVVERSSLSSSSLSGILYARGSMRDGRCAAGTPSLLRNPDVVNAAVKWLMAFGQQGSTVYRMMLSHLTV